MKKKNKPRKSTLQERMEFEQKGMVVIKKDKDKQEAGKEKKNEKK